MAKIVPATRGRMGRSRRGGVATTLPSQRSAVRQLALPITNAHVLHAVRTHREVLPGAVHVAGWLDLARQNRLAASFRQWAVPPAGLRHRARRGCSATAR